MKPKYKGIMTSNFTGKLIFNQSSIAGQSIDCESRINWYVRSKKIVYKIPLYIKLLKVTQQLNEGINQKREEDPGKKKFNMGKGIK